MLSLIVEAILGLVLECIWIVLFRALFRPVILLLSFPFVLVIAFFRRDRYDIAVADLLASVNRSWTNWGGWLVP